MRRTIANVLLAMTLTACADSRPVRGKGDVPTYGLLNEEIKRPDVKYRFSPRNIVLACIFSGTILWPVVTVGWYLYEPVPGQ